MRNLLLRKKCARQLLKMPRQLVNREEQGKLIAQTSGAISMIYNVFSVLLYRWIMRHSKPQEKTF